MPTKVKPAPIPEDEESSVQPQWPPSPGLARQGSKRLAQRASQHWRAFATAAKDGGPIESQRVGYTLHPNIGRALKELEDDFDWEKNRLDELIHKHKLPLPGEDRVFQGEIQKYAKHAGHTAAVSDEERELATQKCLFLYTDLEPDDTFAILCHLESEQAVLVDEPVTVFTTDIEAEPGSKDPPKDHSPIFEKKLILALFTLGENFLRELFIVRHSKEKKLGQSYERLGGPDDRLRDSAQRLVEQAKQFPNATVEFQIMAPGHGNLEKLQVFFVQEAGGEEGWMEIKKRIKVSIYSGSFNLRAMTKGDLDFIIDLVSETTKTDPFVDVSHFPYVGGKDMLKKIENLAPFVPTLGRELFGSNPYLAHAWQGYAEAFDMNLLEPKKLFLKKSLDKSKIKIDEEEKKLGGMLDENGELKSPEKGGGAQNKQEYDELKAAFDREKADFDRDKNDAEKVIKIYEQGDFWTYVREVANKQNLMKRADFKERIFAALSTYGFHEGPLCDCLCYLNGWLLKNHPDAVDQGENKGYWWVETKMGRSGVISTTTETPSGYEKREGKWFFLDEKKGDKDVTETMHIFEQFDRARYPKLKDHKDLDIIDQMSMELKTKILEGGRLKAVDSEKEHNQIDDRSFKRIDKDYISNFLRSSTLGYRSLRAGHTLREQTDAFYTILKKMHDNSRAMTPVEETKRVFNNKLKAMNAFEYSALKTQITKKGKSLEDQTSLAKDDSMQPHLEKLMAGFGTQMEEHAPWLRSCLLSCSAPDEDFDDSELCFMMEHMWKQRWLPDIFMKHNELFNFKDGPLSKAARLFRENLTHKESFSDARPPSALDVIGGLEMPVTEPDEKVVDVDVSADTKYVFFASTKKIELKRVDDYTTVWSHPEDGKKPKEIKAAAYAMKLHDVVRQVHVVRDSWCKRAVCGTPESPSSLESTKTQHRILVMNEDMIEYICFEGGGKPERIEVPIDRLVVPNLILNGSGELVKDKDKKPKFKRIAFSPDAESIVLSGQNARSEGRLEIFRVDTLLKLHEEMNGGNKDTESKDSKQGSNGSNKDTESKDSKMFHDEPLNSNLIRGGSRFWESTSKLGEARLQLENYCGDGKSEVGFVSKGGAQRSSSEKISEHRPSENPPKKRKQSIAQKAHELQKSRDTIWKLHGKHGYRGQFYISRGSPITCFELSPTSNRIVVGEKKHKAALYVLPHCESGDAAGDTWKEYWEEVGGKEFHDIKLLKPEEVKDVAFSGDGCHLCVGLDSIVQVHDGASGSFIYHLSIRGIKDVSFTRDGTRLAVACRTPERAITMWDSSTGDRLFSKEIKGGAHRVKFSPCDTFCVVASKKKASFLQPGTGKVMFMKERKERIGAVASSECGQYLAFAAGKEVELVELKSGSVVGSVLLDANCRTMAITSCQRNGETIRVLVVAATNEAPKKSSVEIYDIREEYFHKNNGDSPDRLASITFDNSEVTSLAATKTVLTVAHSFDDDRMADDSDNKKGVCWLMTWKNLWEQLRGESKELTGFNYAALQNKALGDGQLPYTDDLVGGKGAVAFPPLSNILQCVAVTDAKPKIEHAGFNDITGQDDNIIPMVAFGGLCGTIEVFDLSDLEDPNAPLCRIARRRHVSEGLPAAVRCCSFIPETGLLAVGGEFASVQVYDPVHNCLPMFKIGTSSDGSVNPTYALAFSKNGSYGAVGDSSGVFVFEVKPKDETTSSLFKIHSDGRSFPAFSQSTRKGDKDIKAKIIVGSFSKQVAVYEDVIELGPPVSMLDEDVQSIKSCMAHNPLLPIFTQTHCTLLDRTINETFNSSGRRQVERYNTIEAIMNTETGPQSIHPRHFLMAIVERDEHMLWMLLKGASSERAAQRLRFDTAKMIPYIIEAKLTPALAKLFDENLIMQPTGCELHAVDATVAFRAEMIQWLGERTATWIQSWYCINFDDGVSAKKNRLRLRWWKSLFAVKNIDEMSPTTRFIFGGRNDDPLQTDKTVSHPEYDHFEPWKSHLSDKKGVMAKGLRVPLPGLGTRMILSQLTSISNQNLSDRIFGSEVMSAVINSVYESQFRARHWWFFGVFFVQFIFWIYFICLFKYHDVSGELPTLTFSKVSSRVVLLLTCSIQLWHEVLQQVGQMVRSGGLKNFMEYFYTLNSDFWNFFDMISQWGILWIVISEWMFYRESEVFEKTKTRDTFLVFMSITTFFLLFKSFNLMRGFPDTAWIVVVLTQNATDMRPFLTVVVVIIVFFTSSFYSIFANMYMDKMLEKQSDDNTNDDGGEKTEDYCELLYDEEDEVTKGLGGSILRALFTVFNMGVLGEFSTDAFGDSARLSQVSDSIWAYLLFVILMTLVQIVALNALIAYLSESFNKVLATQDAKINQALAKLMVEYMDCWEVPMFGWEEMSRRKSLQDSNSAQDCCCQNHLRNLWVMLNGGSLEDLQMATMWTHRLQVSNSHDEQAKTSEKIKALIVENHRYIEERFHSLKKDIDYLKTEILEVRKDGEKNDLLHRKKFGVENSNAN